MISKIAPLMVMGMAAQSYYNKTKQGKKDKEIAKKAAKKRMQKTKCPKCGGKGCSHCKGKGYHK
jgi:type II secretory ATPase GspE/PulE/Tfp pilus assembly ATPase PilB-like protein